MGAKKAQTVGFWYYLGIHFGLCQGPIDALVEIRSGNRTAWSGSQTQSGRISINAPDLFGGEKAEGGIVGELDVMMGEPTQLANDYLAGAQNGPQPAYRGVASTVYRRGKVGAFNPNPKPWTHRIQRALKGWDAPVWYPEKAVIALPGGIQAMNPAHILYQTITDQRWGMGEPRSLINDVSFRAAADVFFSEGLGLCLVYAPSADDPINAFQQRVIDHVAGAMTQSRADGLYYLDLIRQIADTSGLPVIAESDVLELTYEPSTLADAVNEIRVEWRDPLTNTDRVTTPVQALGNITSQRGVVSETRVYRGLATEALALRVAARDLSARALPLARLQIVSNRRLWDRRPGQAVRVQLPSEGLADVVFRVGDIDFGRFEDGRIRLTLVQDVSQFPASVYAQPQDTLWLPPDPTPVLPPIARFDESTYRDVVQTLSAGDQAVLPADAGFLLVSAARPLGSAITYALATATTGEQFVERATGDWSPSAVLAASVSVDSTSWSLTGVFGLDRVGIGTAARVGDEIVRVDAINLTASTITVGRGCVDSVPVVQAQGQFVFFSDDFLASDSREYSDGETVSAQVLTRTFSQQIDPAQTLSGSVVMDARQSRPYPPGRLRVNGASSPSSVTSPVALTWAHRDRLLQDDQLIDTDSLSVGPEPGVEYRVVVEQPLGTVISDQTTAATSSTSVPVATGIPVKVSLWSVRAGLESRHRHVRVFGVDGALPVGVPAANVNGGFEGGLTGWSVIVSFGGASSATLTLTTAPDQIIAGQQSGRLQRASGNEVTFVRVVSGQPVLMNTEIALSGLARRLNAGSGTVSIAVAIRVREATGDPTLTVLGGNLFSDFTNLTGSLAGQVITVPDKGDKRALHVPAHPGDLVFDAGILVQSPVAAIDVVLDGFVVTWVSPS